MRNVTILDVAKARLATKGIELTDSISMQHFDDVGLPMLGGCKLCGANVAAYNACPSTTGYLLCKSGCIGDRGFPSVKAFEAWNAYRDALAEAANDGQEESDEESDENE